MAELRRTQVPNRPSLRRGWFVAAVVVIAVVAGAAGTVALRAGDDEPDLGRDEPGRDGDLAAVQRAVGEARSVRFTFTAETHHNLGDLDPVDVAPERSVGSGEWTSDRWRMLTHGDDGSATEMVLDGDIAYVRATADAGAIGTEPWARREDAIASRTEGLTGPGSTDELGDLGLGQEVDDLMAVLVAEGVYLSSDDGVVNTGDLWADDPAAVGDPAGFLDAIAYLSEPTPLDGAAGPATMSATGSDGPNWPHQDGRSRLHPGRAVGGRDGHIWPHPAPVSSETQLLPVGCGVGGHPLPAGGQSVPAGPARRVMLGQVLSLRRPRRMPSSRRSGMVDRRGGSSSLTWS